MPAGDLRCTFLDNKHSNSLIYGLFHCHMYASMSLFYHNSKEPRLTQASRDCAYSSESDELKDHWHIA